MTDYSDMRCFYVGPWSHQSVSLAEVSINVPLNFPALFFRCSLFTKLYQTQVISWEVRAEEKKSSQIINLCSLV